jgi:hypothetical protein
MKINQMKKNLKSWWDKFICAKCGKVAKFCECPGGAQGI